MTAAQLMRHAGVEWSWAGRPMDGEQESGDRHVVVALPDGVLMAVIDGLGHGPEAARAARLAASVLESYAGDDVAKLLRRCHRDLSKTRGAVMSLVRFHTPAESMTWVGVGNVEGLLIRKDASATRAREVVPAQGGVVGYVLPTLRPETVTVGAGDLLVMATDGISSAFSDALTCESSPLAIAESILGRHAKATDDSLVLVARYQGISPEVSTCSKE